MHDLEQAVADVLHADADDYDPAARDRVLKTLARATNQRRTPRRRVWTSVIAVAALTAAIVLTGTLAHHLNSGPGDRDDAPGLLASLDVPPGTRLVGLGQVVVAVPAAWVNWQPSCTEPDTGYVYFPPVAAIRCLMHVDRPHTAVPSLGIESTATPEALEVLRTMDPAGAINGMDVTQDDPDCADATCTQHIAVPEAGVLFTVRYVQISRIPGTMFSSIRDSLMRLPDGLTTVPHQDDHIVGSTGSMAADLMRAHGFEVVTEVSHARPIAGDVLMSIDPRPGSPLESGGTVTLTVTGGEASPPDSTPPRPDPITMATVRRLCAAQQFRPYTGPTPASFSEARAVRRVAETHGYSLGLRDVGVVHENGTVTWTPVRIVASVYLVDDVNQLALGGRLLDPGASDPPLPARPGWVKDIGMYDARTGAFVVGHTS